MADAIETPVVAEKTFTQSDLDRIVKERIERERGKYSDYEDVKAKAARLAEIENSQKTEAQKLADQLKEIRDALGLKDSRIKELEGSLTETKRASLAGSVASKLGAHDPNDANILAAIANIDPAGANAAGDIEAALKSLATAKPYLFKQAEAAPGQARLEKFNPSGVSGGAATDRQKVEALLRNTGVGNYGPLSG